MNISVETENLMKNRFINNSEDLGTFEKTLNNILSLKNVDHISILCRAFVDEIDQHDVMFNLVHAIEYYYTIDHDQALKVFIQSTPSMFPQAKEWAEILHRRVINDEESRTSYCQFVRLAEWNTQLLISQLLNNMKKGDAEWFDNKGKELSHLLSVRDSEDTVRGTIYEN